MNIRVGRRLYSSKMWPQEVNLAALPNDKRRTNPLTCWFSDSLYKWHRVNRGDFTEDIDDDLLNTHRVLKWGRRRVGGYFGRLQNSRGQKFWSQFSVASNSQS
jgi:hypothetical protein